MKKLVYIFMAFAVTMIGVKGVSAEQVIIPVAAHYGGSTDYTQFSIKNLSDQVMDVVVTFSPNVTTDLSNTLTVATTQTFTIAGSTVRSLRTVDSNFWSSTTILKLARVSVQTSGTNQPFVGPASADGTGIDGVGAGPVSVSALFIHLNGSVPSGFSYPAIYLSRTWDGLTTTVSALTPGLVGWYTVDNWEQ